MPSRAQSITITYTAWDTGTNAGKPGDVANHTLRWIKDGTAAAPTNSATEVDATNAPGEYKITLTTAECTCDSGKLVGKSSTSGVSIIPIAFTFEQLPTQAAGAASGLHINGSNAGTTTFGAMTITGAFTLTGGMVGNHTGQTTKYAVTLLNSDVSGNLPADVQTIKSQSVTSTGAFSFDAETTAQTRIGTIFSGATVIRANDASGNAIAPSGTALNNTVWTNTKAGYVDASISSVLTAVSNIPTPSVPTASANAAAVRTNLAAELARIDVAIGSRMETFSYIAPLDAAATRLAIGLSSANTDQQFSDLADLVATRASSDQADEILDELPSGGGGSSNIRITQSGTVKVKQR